MPNREELVPESSVILTLLGSDLIFKAFSFALQIILHLGELEHQSVGSLEFVCHVGLLLEEVLVEDLRVDGWLQLHILFKINYK